MRVRAYRPADATAIVQISPATGQVGPGTGADPDYLAFLHTVGTVLVAAQPAGTITGCGGVKPASSGLLLSDPFIDPACHGHGTGARLLAALLAAAPQAGGWC